MLRNAKRFIYVNGLGNYIGITHDGEFQTYYGHLKKNSLLVSEGDTVSQGQVIAQVASSGNSTDPHLHFELWYDSTFYIDPFSGPCGNGFATIYGTYCDTTFIVFDKGISDLHIIDHDADPDFLNGQIVHWYQGYFNTDIYFDCKSLSDKGKINKKTPEISFNISGLIDQTTGGYVEEYGLQLVLTRND